MDEKETGGIVGVKGQNGDVVMVTLAADTLLSEHIVFGERAKSEYEEYLNDKLEIERIEKEEALQ